MSKIAYSTIQKRPYQHNFSVPSPHPALWGVRFRSRLVSYAALIDLPWNERSAQATRLLRTFCSKWASLTRIPRSSCTLLCFQRTHAKDRKHNSKHARTQRQYEILTANKLLTVGHNGAGILEQALDQT